MMILSPLKNAYFHCLNDNKRQYVYMNRLKKTFF